MNRGRLHPGWRLVLATAGITACAFGVWIYLWPPDRTKRTATPDRKITLVTDEPDPTTFCIALWSSGVLLVFVAANGRRLVSINSSGATFDPPNQSEVSRDMKGAKPVAQKLTTRRGAPLIEPPAKVMRLPEGGSIEIFKPTGVPIRVLADLGENAPDDPIGPGDVEYGFRARQADGEAWYVKTRAGETVRLDYQRPG